MSSELCEDIVKIQCDRTLNATQCHCTAVGCFTTWYESHVNTHCHGTPAATHCNTMRLVALLLERGKQDHIFNPLVLDCMLVSCLSLNMDIYMNIYIYIHGYIQHKGIHIYTICTYIRTHVYACIYIRLCVHECVCAHTYKLRYTSKP